MDISRTGIAASILSIALVGSSGTRAHGQQVAWNDARTMALVEMATNRRAQQLADTLLIDYQADARGYVTFLAQLGKGFIQIPKVVKVDQVAVEVYWRAPDLSKQRIIGRRDSTLLPTDISYHRDHLGIIQNNFPDLIRLGDGDEVKDVPHPLSAAGLREYDFAVSDSLRIRIPTRDIDVLEVKVRPKDDRQPRVVGALFLDPSEGQVVRMAFSFTYAAFLDEHLEDLSVVLDNALIGTRFWLPHRQEIEIRRTGTWMEFPVRGIIRGRWEIGNYQLNLALPSQLFVGPEYSQAPPEQQRAFVWEGGIMDALPPDVRVATDEEVRRVQEEARSLVRATALARPARLVVAAPRISELARFNRAEGLSVGGGLGTRFGTGLSLHGDARYGLDDRTGKWNAGAGWEGPSRSGVVLFAGRNLRDAGDVAERSTAINSIAAQEFGSDLTDPYIVAAAGVTGEWRLAEGAIVGLSLSLERQRAVGVRARPVHGAFGATLPADALDAQRMLLRMERPRSPWIGGTDAGAEAEIRVQRARDEAGNTHTMPVRLFASVEMMRAIGSGQFLRSWSMAAFAHGAMLPVQERVYLGGPVTAPGYDYHALVGDYGFAQRLEWRTPVPMPRIRLGRFGSTPGSGTLVPYIHLASAGVRLTDRTGLAVPGLPGMEARLTGLTGFRPSAGIALLSLYDLLRIDVARGLRSGRWMINVDASRDFWNVL